MSIAILVPTKGRAEKFRRMVDSACKTSDALIQVYCAVSLEEQSKYKECISGVKTNVFMATGQEYLPTVAKWNMLAELALKDSSNKLFMLGSDDIIFSTPLWDKALLEHYAALENKIHVYHLQDSRDKDGTPHVIVTREYIEAVGYFLPPIFLHWYIDSWTVEMAKSAGVFTHMRDYELIHDKPSDSGNPDATHNGIRAQGWKKRDDYVAEKMQSWLGMEKDKLRMSCQRRSSY